MEIAPWHLVAMTSGLLTIGIAVGSFASRFVTRTEFQQALRDIHTKITAVGNRVDDVFTKLTE